LMYEPIYKEFAEKNDSIFVIAPSSELSGTFRSASVAAQDFPEADIRVIDSRSLAGGFGQMVLQAWDWIQQGMQADELETNLKNMVLRNKTYFVVDTLEYLHKGGRIGGAQALVGSILQVKPILYLKDGRTEPLETQRTKKRAVARLKQFVLTDCPPTPESRLSVSQCDAYDEAQEMADFFSENLGIKQIPIYEAPPAIVVHGGPKILSASFFTAN
jgi:DegV family protein with EDD domain